MNDVQTPHTVSHQIARGEDEITLAELLGMVWEGRWTIVVATVLVTSVGIAYALLAQPIYQADALIHVESERSIMPGHASLDLLQEANIAAEIRLLRSRMVIERVVNERNMDIRAEPVRFPIIGGYIARRPLENGKLRQPMFGLPLFAWGGEHIEVAHLVVPESWHGERLTLVALDDGRYQLSGPKGRTRHVGKVGELYASEDGSVQALIREVVARPGTRFNVVRRASGDAVRDLQRGVRITDAGRGSGGVLRLSLEGSSPVDVQATLNAITNAYVRQNVERRSQEAEQRIAFLDEQLPQIRRQLESAEERLSHYRRENEALDLSAEGLALLEQTVGVEQRAVEISLKRSELSRNYASQHPRMIALNQQEQQLLERRSGLDSRIQGLPASQQELLRLQREVEVTTALYTAMLNQAQELRVVRA
ncbi:MAG: Wzz/FepE/Etk N-terminal domain-containing protein, partial [Aquisalimonadaceae bacterium]